MGRFATFIEKQVYKKVRCLIIDIPVGNLNEARWWCNDYHFRNGNIERQDNIKEGILPDLGQAELTESSLPIVLCLVGSSIVYAINPEESDNWETIISKRLPGAKKQDFAAQRSASYPNLVGILRTNKLSEIVSYLNSQNISCQSIQIGTVAFADIYGALDSAPDTLQLPSLRLHWNQQQLSKVEVSQDTPTASLSIAGEQHPIFSAIAIATTAPLFAARNPDSWQLDSLSKEAKASFQTKWLIKNGGITFLAGLLLLLLANFFLADYYQRNNQQLSYQQRKFSYQLNLLDSLDQRLSSRKILLQNTSAGDRLKIPQYLDRIGQSIPPGISLTGLTAAPLQESANQINAPKVFISDVYLLEGLSKSPTIIARWLNTLKSADWIQNVELTNNQNGKFSVRLEVK